MKFTLAGALVVLAVGAAPKSLLAQRADFARIAPSPAELMVTAALRPLSMAPLAAEPPRHAPWQVWRQLLGAVARARF